MTRTMLTRTIRTCLLAGSVGLLAGAAAAWWWWSRPAQPAEPFIEVATDAYVLAVPEPIAPFRLVGHDGKPFDNAALQGRWTFLFFGFTHCPDICPTTLAVFNEIHRALRERGGAGDVRFVMVSVDPARDTPQVLAKYVPAFNPEFLGLTGESAEIARLTDGLGVKYARSPGPTPDNYFVDHSSSVLLADPQGRFRGVFAAPHVPKNMLQGLQEIRKR
jgi:protein SCO1